MYVFAPNASKIWESWIMLWGNTLPVARLQNIVAIVGSTTDDDKFYQITQGPKGILSCSCPHNSFRHVICKHIDIYRKYMRTKKVAPGQYIAIRSTT
jgi:hypothetical protein